MPARFTRRHLMVAVGASAVFGSLKFGHSRIARPAAPSRPLSDEAKALIAQAWQGLDPHRVLDTHTHVVGLGQGGTGCYVGEKMQSFTSPMERLKFGIYLDAAGITDSTRVDQQYMERLSALISSQTPHGRNLLFAFDANHHDDGTVNKVETEFFTPNEYVLKLAKAAPELFAACVSIHPYRADAVEALEAAAVDGAVAVKWLPNAMNINPASEKCDAFYEALVRLQIPLISHAGEEKAVHAEERQRLGNPLHVRRALEHGVKVVVAHCASLGENPDLDAGEGAPWVDNFELFMRLMNEPKWQGLLFGDISALTQVNRLGTPLQTVMQHPEVQRRMINGSDYPLPAINALMQTGAVVKAGYLTEDERRLLNEIDQHNPLLFDFVMKRTLKLNGQRLSDDIFMVRPEVMPRLAS